MDSELAVDGRVTTRTRILAYLGELRQGDWVEAMKLCNDLALRFSTTKNILDGLVERGMVSKDMENRRGRFAKFRIDPRAAFITYTDEGVEMRQPYLPPEWDDAYGKHPYHL